MDCISLYKYLIGRVKKAEPDYLLGQHATEVQEILFKHKNNFVPWMVVKHWDRSCRASVFEGTQTTAQNSEQPTLVHLAVGSQLGDLQKSLPSVANTLRSLLC